jgi:hypothetical protein
VRSAHYITTARAGRRENTREPEKAPCRKNGRKNAFLCILFDGRHVFSAKITPHSQP